MIVQLNNLLFNRLPLEIIDLIQQYIPLKILFFINSYYYFTNHKQITILLKNNKIYDSYVRDTIRRDNDIVFNLILNENINIWLKYKKYYYDSIIYANYLYFIRDYGFINNSKKCNIIINNKLKEYGLLKNIYKKKIHKYIRWNH
jgi:hypothetical protein